MGASPPRSGGEGVLAGANPPAGRVWPPSWILAAFWPKRKIAPYHLARGDFYLPPFTASDSRHNLRLRTALSRGAAGRVCLRPLGRRRGGCAYGC